MVLPPHNYIQNRSTSDLIRKYIIEIKGGLEKFKRRLDSNKLDEDSKEKVKFIIEYVDYLSKFALALYRSAETVRSNGNNVSELVLQEILEEKKSFDNFKESLNNSLKDAEDIGFENIFTATRRSCLIDDIVNICNDLNTSLGYEL